MLRKNPLIVILGSTGVGKTKLSIELARRYGGEIISADSMQVYSDLDVVTAKATREEQEKAPHHMLDVVQPSEPFTVIQYRNAVLPIIEDLLSKSKMPIVCGGTNYYIESLLWDVLVTKGNSRDPSPTPASSDSDEDFFSPSKNAAKYELMSSAELHAHLANIDPKSADRLHPNNRRKILRGQTGRDGSRRQDTGGDVWRRKKKGGGRSSREKTGGDGCRYKKTEG